MSDPYVLRRGPIEQIADEVAQWIASSDKPTRHPESVIREVLFDVFERSTAVELHYDGRLNLEIRRT